MFDKGRREVALAPVVPVIPQNWAYGQYDCMSSAAGWLSGGQFYTVRDRRGDHRTETAPVRGAQSVGVP